MKSFALFVALTFAASTNAWKQAELPEPTFGSRFTSIKEEADRFTTACRDVLNGEGPTFTIDVSDHSLSDGVGEKKAAKFTYLSCAEGRKEAAALFGWLQYLVSGRARSQSAPRSDV